MTDHTAKAYCHALISAAAVAAFAWAGAHFADNLVDCIRLADDFADGARMMADPSTAFLLGSMIAAGLVWCYSVAAFVRNLEG
jgi:hypothetical protein